jgi:oxygen-dependent protoporphyrinogen oxidase
MKVVIIGGGISGLATAYFVRQFAPTSEVLLLEKEPVLGGTMHTESINGFLFEAGGNGFLSNKPDTLDLVRAVGAEPLLMQSSDAARIRYIYTDRLYPLPTRPREFLTTRLLRFRDKLRVVQEVFIPPRREPGDESLQSFGYRRVGKAFTDTFLDAMAAGIFASVPRKLSMNAAFPAVVRLEQEFGGLFKGLWKSGKKQAGPGGVLMSFTWGVRTFIEHLGKVLDADIRRAEEVTALRQATKGYVVTTRQREVTADRVVLATPAYVSAMLMEGIDPGIARQLGDIVYSPVVVVGFGYDQLQYPLGGFGLLTTSSAAKEILGILWDSAIFPDRAPPGKKSLRVLIGGQRNPELAHKGDEALLQIALQGIQETMGITNEYPTTRYLKKWERGIPAYQVGHGEHVADIMRRLGAYPGLYLNSNAYAGIGLNDCVANSKKCAHEVAKVHE